MMQLRYFVPFKAQEGVDAQLALKEKLINIEGVAIDTSVNANRWQIPQEDLDALSESLAGAQLRVDHAESALMVVGKVSKTNRVGSQVFFTAEVGDEKLIEKILRNYVNHVSVQVDSDDVECSKCKKNSRSEGMLVHLCPGAFEVVHKPKVRELSIVASPAYQNTAFKPVGFAAAMNEGQFDAIFKTVTDSQLSEGNKDVGSKRKLQEPEKQKLNAKEEVRHLSEHDAQQDASPHQAQGVVNTALGESAPKQVNYEDFMNQLTQLEKQINASEGSEADMDALKKKVADLEGEVAKKATKRNLSKKLSDLQKQLQQPEDESDGEQAEEAAAEAKRSGKGIVAVDEIQRDALGNYDWFKDMLKAHKKLTGFQ
jgi:hypothetical protein